MQMSMNRSLFMVYIAWCKCNKNTIFVNKEFIVDSANIHELEDYIMSSLYGIRKYAIEGENAAKVYDALVDSFFYKTYSECLTLDYKEGLLLIVEEWSNYPGFGDYILPFLIGDNFYWWDRWEETGEVTTNDFEGKYFTV